MLKTTLALAGVAVLAACASHAPKSPMSMQPDNAMLPEAVRVPAGTHHLMTATGVGEITYECRMKSGMAGQHEWAFVAPQAMLYSDDRRMVGRYYGGPTWESTDGSKVTGKQLGAAPGRPGNIGLQLIKADPAMGSGAMSDVGYIQRLNTKGGVAPAAACNASTQGARQQVKYEADYVFYRR